ncbi:hypothetical protein [Sphingomonas sp. TDK1]|uniref:hypothetical protein n=1 Tax=Sphingomonas sp. TDK1 TaxID=453247 RepID=UPI000AC72D84|nr:hypothetical protein [Sphingomonas sp. TDK1]
MGWLIEAAIQSVAEIFGYQLGRGRPWWVEVLASLGCLLTLGLAAGAVMLLLR